MISNIDQFINWISIAISDLKSAITLYKNGFKASVVYHAQQFAEKICKALIILFGQIPKKTHFPSIYLDGLVEEFRQNNKLSDEEVTILTHIINLASTLEDEKERPRYGIWHADRLIPPDDLYSETEVELFLNDAIEIGEKVIEFLEKRSILTKIPLDIISDLEGIIHEFKERKRGKSNN